MTPTVTVFPALDSPDWRIEDITPPAAKVFRLTDTRSGKNLVVRLSVVDGTWHASLYRDAGMSEASVVRDIQTDEVDLVAWAMSLLKSYQATEPTDKISLGELPRPGLLNDQESVFFEPAQSQDSKAPRPLSPAVPTMEPPSSRRTSQPGERSADPSQS